MSTLYELTGEYLELLSIAEDQDVDAEVLADTLEALDGEIESKADGYAKVLKELDGQAEMLKSEIARLTARRKSLESNIEAIKKNLENSMVATGKTKFKTDLFSFNIAKNPASLKIAEGVDISSIPNEYLVIPEPQVDKSKVKEAIKNGTEFAWATLVQSESLRIR